MSAYSKSGSADKAAKIPSNTPLSAHLRKRFHTEDHLPKLSGRSRHGAPARTSHKTASINRLLFSPDLPGSPFLPGRRGAIRSHWASFNNVRLKAHPQFFSLESDRRCFENPSPPNRVNRSHKTAPSTQMSTGPRMLTSIACLENIPILSPSILLTGCRLLERNFNRNPVLPVLNS